MARIYLIVGPVGAGKSTFVRQLCQNHAALPFTLDEWMAVLFSKDRPDSGVMDWYVERTARCIDQIWRHTERAIDIGIDVVLEIGLIQQNDRERLYERIDTAGYELTIYVLDAHRELRWERVQQRNVQKGETFSMEVSYPVFELANDLWEPLDEAESSGRDVRLIDTNS
jgi:predicted kinase